MVSAAAGGTDVPLLVVDAGGGSVVEGAEVVDDGAVVDTAAGSGGER